MQIKAFVHDYTDNGSQYPKYKNFDVNLPFVPRVGEALELEKAGPLYYVDRVIYTPYSGESDVDLYVHQMSLHSFLPSL